VCVGYYYPVSQFVFLTSYYQDNQINEQEMGGECSEHGEIKDA
jgi:hypothetical protein